MNNFIKKGGISTKKLLICCLIALTIGNLTACTSKKETQTIQTSEDQELEEYQPEFVTLNYNNEGVYQYKVIKCNKDKAQELIKSGKPFKKNINVTVTFANGDEFDGFEHKYGQNGECCYIRVTDGDKIETYDVLEIKLMESLEICDKLKTKLMKPLDSKDAYEEGYEPEAIKRHFKVNNIELHTLSRIQAVRCTEEEIKYIEKTKTEVDNRLIVADEFSHYFRGTIGCYGDKGKKVYLNLLIGNDEYYFKVISTYILQ